jgi:phosphatidate cytidylyltransferase
MALNKEVFRTRALSALVFVAVMLVGLLWNHWSFLVLFSIIHFGCWREYLRLVEKIHGVTFHRLVHFGLMLMGFGLMLSFCGPAYAINGYGLRENLCLPLSLAGFIVLVMGIFSKQHLFTLKSFGAAALGWLYISLSWGMMIGLRSEDSLTQGGITATNMGGFIPMLLIVSIWINDTCAYLVGSFIGKTPFSKISPKKTWEGTAGGAIICIVVVGFFAKWFNSSFISIPVSAYGKLTRLDFIPVFILFAIPAIAAVIGTIGDLLESKIKRMADVKDSGTMLPGHGGFMDRFDSLLLATPFVWLLMKLV